MANKPQGGQKKVNSEGKATTCIYFPYQYVKKIEKILAYWREKGMSDFSLSRFVRERVDEEYARIKQENRKERKQ